MKIELKEVRIRELVKKYKDEGDEGVSGYDGRLDIRPPYQREFVYNDKQREAVIDTVTKGFPLNVMYWAVRDDGDYEIIDGQQRTISICEYVDGVFSYNKLYFDNFEKEEQEQILDYKLTVYECSGTVQDKLDWFKTINIAGEELTPQELRNAVYHGPWVTDAKRHFSRRSSAGVAMASDYIKGRADRQEYLEEAIKWISNNQIEDYMGQHQHDDSASELWEYFTKVIDWIQSVFTKNRKEMEGLPWGEFYLKYKGEYFDQREVEKKISELYEDVELKNNKGIYAYILSGDSKHLNLRTFETHVKKAIYEKQGGKCKHCGKEFPLSQMHADHIKPWSLGGETVPENCQVLCQDCNAKKSDNY